MTIHRLSNQLHGKKEKRNYYSGKCTTLLIDVSHADEKLWNSGTVHLDSVSRGSSGSISSCQGWLEFHPISQGGIINEKN